MNEEYFTDAEGKYLVRLKMANLGKSDWSEWAKSVEVSGGLQWVRTHIYIYSGRVGLDSLSFTWEQWAESLDSLSEPCGWT